MPTNIRNNILVFALIAGAAPAQTIVGTGYRTPPLKIAPGQVVPLLVTGLHTILPNRHVQAPTVPLPTSLGGISVTLIQPPTSYTASLPIFSIDQFDDCPVTLNPTAPCFVTTITVQIPFDITVPNPLQLPPVGDVPGTALIVNENGTASQLFLVTPRPDRVHVLESCDVDGQTFETGTCYPIVTHADGSLVLQDASGPGGALTHTAARPGEVLVMYAWGLGVVSPTVAAGTASPSPAAPVKGPVNLRFDYSANASPSLPLPGVQFAAAQAPAFGQPPLFAGLTPTEVGLYQVNFIVPDPPPGTLNCGQPIQSNLTVSVDSGGQSFSGAAICVDVN